MAHVGTEQTSGLDATVAMCWASGFAGAADTAARAVAKPHDGAARHPDSLCGYLVLDNGDRPQNAGIVRSVRRSARAPAA